MEKPEIKTWNDLAMFLENKDWWVMSHQMSFPENNLIQVETPKIVYTQVIWPEEKK